MKVQCMMWNWMDKELVQNSIMQDFKNRFASVTVIMSGNVEDMSNT